MRCRLEMEIQTLIFSEQISESDFYISNESRIVILCVILRFIAGHDLLGLGFSVLPETLGSRLVPYANASASFELKSFGMM